MPLRAIKRLAIISALLPGEEMITIILYSVQQCNSTMQYNDYSTSQHKRERIDLMAIRQQDPYQFVSFLLFD